METPTPQGLAPKLEHALQQVPEKELSARLRRVYLAAAQAIARLSDLDLVQYETHVEEVGADLSLWEEMAPVLRDTVMDVNALLSVMREAFPEGQTQTRSFDARAAASAVQESMQLMAGGITQLGEAMRNPRVMADRWNLLAELQAFRSRFREQVGSMVYESISCFCEVPRKEVVPGYAEELRAAIVLRATGADLLRVISARLDKVREAEPEDVQWNAQQLQTELDTFGRTAAYKALRAQDKRRLVEARSAVGRLATEDSPSRAELLMLCQELRDFVAGLREVNLRAILQQHDREVMAHCGVRLEQAAQVLQTQPAVATRALAEAVAGAQSLYGRSAQLDAFLRKTRKTQWASLTGGELQAHLESLQQLIAELHFS